MGAGERRWEGGETRGRRRVKDGQKEKGGGGAGGRGGEGGKRGGRKGGRTWVEEGKKGGREVGRESGGGGGGRRDGGGGRRGRGGGGGGRGGRRSGGGEGTHNLPSLVCEMSRFCICSIMVWGRIMTNDCMKLHIFQECSVTARRYVDEELEP
ncbi:glycine-rich RNA-binding protein 10-like [Stegodyphus dumicola]|uniref:glycine-rich RNA-binding protein 10-like n=1 Tax=Stegodyphus dumicola TaxID=202533 RepID=UPI0015AE4BF1|nr:glycine-rich RNA-binding protein 10-like [Stegodyphus dumicola]